MTISHPLARVRRILDQAAGDACADYQGYGRFWHRPVAELLTMTIYGVRMIEPVSPAGAASAGFRAVPAAAGMAPRPKPGGGCCHGPSAGGAPPAPEPPGGGMAPPASPSAIGARAVPGRGAASGLVKGLKGEAPFDGSQFPRLPWGGQAVAAEDIQFIQDWIDAGCPEQAEASGVEGGDSLLAARHRGDAAHPPSDRVANAFHDEGGTVKMRKNIEALTVEELRRFRAAIAQMKSLDAYPQDERSFGYWARIHANLCQHGWEEFLTWHRAYLYFFEQQLQDVDPAVTLPYWDWAQYDQDWTPGQVDSGTIPEAYRCWLDAAALSSLKGRIPDDWWQKLSQLGAAKFDSAQRLFRKANLEYGSLLDPQTLRPVPPDAPTRVVIDALERVNPLWHRLRWAGPNGVSGLFFESYPRPDDISRILGIDNFFAFGSGPDSHHFFGALENVHNLMHNFAGGINPVYVDTFAKGKPGYGAGYDPQNRWEPQYGDMVSAGVTAFDPIFWAHHSNVDRLWAEWQQRHPNTNPDNLDTSLPPWSLTVADTLNTTRLGYEYVKSVHVFETNDEQPFTRFRSAPAGVAAPVLTGHRRAEIRLHRVKFSVHGGGFIRVFLNQPGADVNTPTRGNDHYVGQAALFSGFCVGGPGHCDPPAGPRRPFDRRHRHHKTPGNIRFDATEAVRRLVAKGETDLHLTLVVLDLDGRPKDNALWMGAVSLVFLD